MAFFEMAKTAILTTLKRPSTRRYPAVPAKVTPLSRGKVVIDPARCISCGMCMKKCPSGAICVVKDEKTWSIDRLKCVVCNCCVDVCPVHCLTMETGYSPSMTRHQGVEVIPITYVKPERPPRKEPDEKGGQDS
ncbi:MAG: 4Fe-4S dicluster domain-containing protein [Methanolinea sp.]|jgi:formate hydrogenlyase subunit 6/NADH:ubiquinone oxidoreductase subunit I|nr:4Fe-4S dicluster domain-containing protein [Methanolinea sp.]